MMAPRAWKGAVPEEYVGYGPPLAVLAAGAAQFAQVLGELLLGFFTHRRQAPVGHGVDQRHQRTREGDGPRRMARCGRVLAALHGLAPAGDVRSWVPRENFDPGRWAKLFERVDTALGRRPAGETEQRLADMWGEHRAQLREVNRLTLGLADALRERTDLPDFVACHADPHLGNLILTAEDAPVLIDFDDAVLAPRERDLMFVLGGGVLADTAATPQQQNWFGEGYGPHPVDTDLITYYRGLRTLEDASELAWIVLDPQSTAEERRTALDHASGVFSPTGLLAQTLSAVS